ncbi:MAG: c-type cytochrome [Flavitalea sp.]
MKKFMLIASIVAVIYSCSDAENKSQENTGETSSSNSSESVSTYDSSVGAGKFQNVQISEKLDEAKAEAGLKVSDVKCASCHKMTGERLVGPGWAGVTSRHRPEWILNFITNTDEMLTKDPKAQAQLEVCLVRMPNQSLTEEEAFSVFEFMRKNDGVK